MNNIVKVSDHDGEMYSLIDSECTRLDLPIGTSIQLSPSCAIHKTEMSSASLYKLIGGIYYPLPRYLQSISIQEV